jgi:hypothetical protein
MKCESRFKDAVYGADLFCRTCGMDIGLNPVTKKTRGRTIKYCCPECAESGGK